MLRLLIRMFLSTLPPPVIVVGCHRSGTTLVSNLLQGLGVFMGADLEENAESIYFITLNDELLKMANARWDRPEHARKFVEGPSSGWIQHLKARVHSRGWLQAYWGQHWALRMLLGACRGLRWGWKDPRNTLTLPVWLSLFPQARVIIVTRNGVDVATSLVARERGQLRDAAWGLAFEDAFSLWEEYVQLGLANTQRVVEQRRLGLRYEDLLEDPGGWLMRIRSFLQLQTTNSQISALCAMVDSTRSRRYLQSPELMERYNACRRRPSMLTLGFDYGDSAAVAHRS